MKTLLRARCYVGDRWDERDLELTIRHTTGSVVLREPLSGVTFYFESSEELYRAVNAAWQMVKPLETKP